MVYDTDGVPLQGLTCGNDADRRVEFIIPPSWRTKTSITFYVETSMNRMFGNAAGGDNIQPPIPDRYFTLVMADIVVPYMPAWHLLWDFTVISDCARELPQNSWECKLALSISQRIMDTFQRQNRDSLKACRKIAEEFIGSLSSSDKVYSDTKISPYIYGIGHCHIDTAWLWPFDETKRKVARSWASQVDLMERYPEHRFTCSQAQQYKWLKQDYPALFERVAAKVKSGQFHPIGGTWVENDTNMPSGESLVRQFLYGQRFFEKNFGQRCKVFWLPDTFGYSAQLPQIVRLADMEYFFTQKLSWNNINKFPHTTFNWVGLDGSQVISHMAPSETYNAGCNVGDMIRSVTQHKSLEADKSSLLIFGNGDGGGGPVAPMLEKLRRCRGVSNTIGSLPPVKMGDSVDDFFEQLRKNTQNGAKLATWYGELYFELHRGTYTSQAFTKRNNRYSETLMREVEYFATLASLFNSDYSYPKSTIDDLWEIILLCQFHDVLPGSSIEMVYEDTRQMYAGVFAEGAVLLENALGALHLRLESQEASLPLVINPLFWPRTEKIQTASQNVQVSIGAGELKQAEPTGLNIDLEFSATLKEESAGVYVLSNGIIETTIKGGQILSFRDLQADRELVPKGERGNRLLIYEDQPLYWDAWDVEIYHLQLGREIGEGEVEVIQHGPETVELGVTHRISENSNIKTRIRLDAGSKNMSYKSSGSHPLTQLHFYCDVEWHENRSFLKVEFPWDLLADTATYESQFGVIKRPTHYNTTWDQAKFEVVCHKWADLSENGYGVAILNDSKYGFATAGQRMRLSLLRAPKAPDAHADIGHHQFRYAILPHRGTAADADVVRAAINFQSPMRFVGLDDIKHKDKLDNILNAIKLEGDASIVLETMKRGEDDSDVTKEPIKKRKGRAVILRMYEAYGGHGDATIVT